ncbi:MAG: hypothetical protein HQ521_00745 [Bacteroidetes bacterium]|nr:hypothetical protein [Bacteroidota bacterium]
MLESNTIKENILKIYIEKLKTHNYPNEGKLSALMDWWLDIFYIAEKNQISLPANSTNLYKNISENDYNFPVETIKQKRKVRIKDLIRFLISFIPISYGVLLGGKRKKWDKLFYLITIEKMKQIEWSLNNKLKEDFLTEIKVYLLKETYQNLKLALSDKFFMNPIDIKGIPLVFYGAPDNLFKEQFLKLLFVNQKLKFIGIQHGGCTLEYSKNRFDKYDQSISDKMLYWGLGSINIKQNRFKISKIPFRKINQIFLIEALEPNIILKTFFQGSYHIYSNSIIKRNELIDKFYQKLGLIKHPRSRETSHNQFSTVTLMSELPLDIQKKSLFILDLPFQTFMIKAIYENLPFLMFINRAWHKWFTPKYSALLEYLNSQKVLFYWDQEEEFFTYTKKIMITGEINRKNNKNLSDYLERDIN